MSSDPLNLTPYQPRWAGEARTRVEQLAAALGPLALYIDHVGSTAVTGLPAKDVIDLQVVTLTLDPEPIVPRLERAGYRFQPDNQSDPPHPDTEPVLGADDWRKLYFREPVGERRIHIHVRRVRAASARNTLLFRDYLRAHAAARRDYGALKQALAADPQLCRQTYQDLKQPLIAALLRAAQDWAETTRWAPAWAERFSGEPE